MRYESHLPLFASRPARRGSASKVSSRKRRDGQHLRFESLEARSMMTADPATFPVTFNIPSDVQSQGFYAAIFGNLTADYTQQGTSNVLTSGTNVYFDFSLNGGAGDYASSVGLSSLEAEQLTGATFTLDLPNTPVQAGQIVMGVGASPSMPVNGSGAVTSPASSNNPENYFALFEYDIAGSTLDIDASNVDQIGFPFSVTTVPAGAFPADLGIGITLDRETLFANYQTYIQAQGSAAAGFLQSVTYGDGYRILAPDNVLDGIVGGPTQNAVTYTANGSLVIGTNYYYWVSATSASGETTVDNFAAGMPYVNSGTSTNYQTINLSWSQFEGATGYKVYRSTSNDVTTASLIGTVTGGSNLSFSDNGITGTAGTPPTNNYTFNSMNSYFNEAIDAFFAHYDAVDGVEFSIQRDGSVFTGYSQPYQFGGVGDQYIALVLNSPDYSGEDFVILKPYFSTNTDDSNAPAPPVWLQNETQSPGAMILANDGAFNTGGEQPGVNAGVLSDLQNSIVSAFNRGIADNFELRPDDWGNSPLLQSAVATVDTNNQPSTPGQLTPDTYYYVVTGANPKSGGGYHESVIGAEVFATTTAQNASVQLTWLPLDDTVYENYRIYRTTTSGSGYQLIDTVENGNSPPATGYLDDGSKTPTSHSPQAYYAPGSTSNWYAAFLHQNVTNDPANGVSIRGLAYGFGYDDQNGTSTNFTTTIDSTTTVTIDVQPWEASAPTTPDELVILTQPEATRVKSAVTIQFQALQSNGSPFTGGGNVTVQIVGTKKSYTVALDAQSGIGSLSVSNLKEGIYSFKITYPDGPSVTSNAFSVVPKKTTQRVLDLMDAVDDVLNGKSFQKVLKDLMKYWR